MHKESRLQSRLQCLSNSIESTHHNGYQKKTQVQQLSLHKFEERLVLLFAQQNYLIAQLLEKNNNLNLIINKVNGLIKQLEEVEQESQSQSCREEVLNQNLQVRLFSVLSVNQKQFRFRIQLHQNMSLPLFKDRNFVLEVAILDNLNQIVHISNKTFLELMLFTDDYPPKLVEFNHQGSRIFKGNTLAEVNDGIARFKKIQIKEVSSHFKGGVLTIVIKSKSEMIKPLIIEKVTVKAKKMKKKQEEVKI